MPAGETRGWQGAGLGPGQARARTLVTAAALVALTMISIVGALAMKHTAESAREGQRRLYQVSALLYSVDAKEWRALKGEDDRYGLPARVASDFDAISVLLGESERYGLPRSEAALLREAIAEYRVAVAAELPLISQSRIEEALVLDNTRVDPAFENAERVLGQRIEVMNAIASRRSLLADLGLLMSISLPLAASGWLLLVRVRQHAEQRLGARYQALVERSSDLVLVCDVNGNLSFTSPAAARTLDALGFDEGVNVFDAIHPDDVALVRRLVSDPIEPDVLPIARFGHRDTWHLVELDVQDLRSEPMVAGVVLTGRDITERRSLEAELARQAHHDALTGLPNRVALADHLRAALAMGRPGAVATLILVDLDRFKDINDALGHDTGDRFLVHVGRRVSQTLGSGEVVYRLGGDEFAVLALGLASVGEAKARAEKLRIDLAAPFLVEGAELQIDASIGVVMQGLHGDDEATLLRRADTAMYVAKSRGVGVFMYDAEADSNQPERLMLLADLRHAIHRGELELFYQPQVNISTGELIGAEALVRWRHPEHGLISPDRFIPLAEQTGLIGPLSEMVLEMAATDARRWIDLDAAMRVSVNLSWRNLVDEDLDRKVAALLERHDLPPQLLLLEVTESAIMSQTGTEVLDRLHKVGVQLAIDDFGAGYTSLGQLRTLPVDELKIDRSFVITMSTERSNDLIVRSVVDLARNLGLRTVAEGVEDAESLRLLDSYGCAIAQGYLLAKPLPLAEFEMWRRGRIIAPAPGDLAARAPLIPLPRASSADSPAPVD